MVGTSAMPGNDRDAGRGAGSPLLGRRAFLGGAATLGAYGVLAGGLAACSESSTPGGAARGGGGGGPQGPSGGGFPKPGPLHPRPNGLVTGAPGLRSGFDTPMLEIPNDPAHQPG